VFKKVDSESQTFDFGSGTLDYGSRTFIPSPKQMISGSQHMILSPQQLMPDPKRGSGPRNNAHPMLYNFSGWRTTYQGEPLGPDALTHGIMRT